MKPYFSATLGAVKPFFVATLGQRRRGEEKGLFMRDYRYLFKFFLIHKNLAYNNTFPLSSSLGVLRAFAPLREELGVIVPQALENAKLGFIYCRVPQSPNPRPLSPYMV
jgi:hypothetical protein